jgi:hypothetical protein
MEYRDKLMKNGHVWAILIAVVAFIVTVAWQYLRR